MNRTKIVAARLPAPLAEAAIAAARAKFMPLSSLIAQAINEKIARERRAPRNSEDQAEGGRS